MELAPWPYYSLEEIDEVKKVLASGLVNSWAGSQTSCFENEFSNYLNVKHAVAVSNGTVALTLAYMALGIGSGDEVITTPRTYIATSSTLLLLGAKPIFADVDKESGNITASSIEPLINQSTKAISVVHLGGWPADMKSICSIAKKYNLYIIEDCSQAHGASIRDKKVGSFGNISTWSFCQDKIISTGGEGGMVTTNNEKFYKLIWSLKDHGKSFKLVHENKEKSVGFKWLHNQAGSNFRLTEMQSAIGRIQLKKLNNTNLLRARNAGILYETLKDIKDIRIPMPTKEIKHAWYKFYIFLKDINNKKFKRDDILKAFSDQKIKAFSGSCSEIYLENCFKNYGYNPKERLISAKELGETSLMFLVHQTISKDQMTEYALQIRNLLLKFLDKDF